MSDFIVLGLIPGTNIQIGLFSWAIISAIICAGFLIVWRERRARTLRFLLIRLSVAHATRTRQQA
jgi:hypothetical protein